MSKGTILMTIRKYCVKCHGDSEKGARECTSEGICELWRYRMGEDPDKTRRGNAANLPGRATGIKSSPVWTANKRQGATKAPSKAKEYHNPKMEENT